MIKKIHIAGASVAGLSTALELLTLDNSVDVALYEKKSVVGEHVVCGGAISSFMLHELDIHFPRHVIASTINAVRIYSPNGAFWELSSRDEVYGYVLWRNLFEKHLAALVRDKSGQIWLNCEVVNIEVGPPGTKVGADGLTGATRKSLGLPMPPLEDIHIGVQRIADLPSHPKNRLDLYFGARFAPHGYTWIFPVGSRKVRIGLGIPLSEKKNPNKLLTNFIDYVGAEPNSPVTAKLLPTAQPSRRLVYNNVLLVGDAGLFCDPATGGGIANAMLSGRYAAKAIHEGNLQKYQSYCSPLTRRNRFRYKLKRILYDLSDENFNELIHGVKNLRPKLTRISWALFQAITTLALNKPKLLLKHKVLRRLVG